LDAHDSSCSGPVPGPILFTNAATTILQRTTILPARKMRRLRIGVVDLVARAPTKSLYARLMHANLASIMPQAIAVWCEEQGHEVHLVCYTGFEDLSELLPQGIDLLFISAFTQAAQ